MILVQKYGGCYLTDMDDIGRIAGYVSRTRGITDGLVIVVAAMHEIAEGMSRRAGQFGGDINESELDSLFSACELETAALMTGALEREGVPAVSVADIRGHSLGIVDIDRGRHEIILDEINRVLEQGRVAVVAGFQGIGEFAMSDRLGRYGAAATAVAIAAGLGCDCELYGNTRGIYTADPELTKSGRVISRISYDEALEMTILGDNDLESRAIEIGKTKGVQIYVGPAFEDDKSGGTYIVNRNVVVEEAAVSGISVYDNILIYTLKGISVNGDMVAELFETLGDLGVNIDVISQQTCSPDSCAVSFSCGVEDEELIDKSFESNFRFRDLDIAKKGDICLVSLVGAGMASHVGVAGKVFVTLARAGIRHYNITTSEISISAAVDSDLKAEAVIALSEAFAL